MPRRRSRRIDTRLTFGAAALAGALLLYLALRPALNGPAYATWLASWSVVALVLYTFDKLQSRRPEAHVLRVPEVTLHGVALLGGFPGAWAGMLLLRHKTRHQLFWAILIASTIAHAILAYLLFR